jgi:hypothetical protein
MNANIRTLGAAVGTAVLAATLAAGTPHYDKTFFALSAFLGIAAVASRWVPGTFAPEGKRGSIPSGDDVPPSAPSSRR